MRRQLSALIFSIEPRPGMKGYAEVIAWSASPDQCCCQPPKGKRFCDVQAGDVLTSEHGPRKVLEVRIFRCHPADDCDRVITSGRAWLRGE